MPKIWIRCKIKHKAPNQGVFAKQGVIEKLCGPICIILAGTNSQVRTQFRLVYLHNFAVATAKLGKHRLVILCGANCRYTSPDVRHVGSSYFVPDIVSYITWNLSIEISRIDRLTARTCLDFASRKDLSQVQPWENAKPRKEVRHAEGVILHATVIP